MHDFLGVCVSLSLYIYIYIYMHTHADAHMKISVSIPGHHRGLPDSVRIVRHLLAFLLEKQSRTAQHTNNTPQSKQQEQPQKTATNKEHTHNTHAHTHTHTQRKVKKTHEAQTRAVILTLLFRASGIPREASVCHGPCSRSGRVEAVGRLALQAPG